MEQDDVDSLIVDSLEGVQPAVEGELRAAPAQPPAARETVQELQQGPVRPQQEEADWPWQRGASVTRKRGGWGPSQEDLSGDAWSRQGRIGASLEMERSPRPRETDPEGAGAKTNPVAEENVPSSKRDSASHLSI